MRVTAHPERRHAELLAAYANDKTLHHLRCASRVDPQQKFMMSFRTYLQSRLAPSSQWYANECLVTGKWTLKFY